MTTEDVHPLALVIEYFEKGREDFPVFTCLVVNTIHHILDGTLHHRELDRLPSGQGQRVRNVCRHFGLQMPT